MQVHVTNRVLDLGSVVETAPTNKKGKGPLPLAFGFQVSSNLWLVNFG